MKIFAKRKRTSSDGAKSSAEQDRTTFASDPIVEELLKKDQSEWNSKEKRMVMRYEKRKAAHDDGPNASIPIEKGSDEAKEVADNLTNMANHPETNENGIEEDEPKTQEENNDSSNTSESDSPPSESDDSDDENTNNAEDQNVSNEAKETSDDKEAVVVTKTSVNSDGIGQDEKVDPDHSVYKMLEKLNSKMKRTLSRRLDREGASALEEVEKEAKKLLGITEGDSSKKRGQDAVNDDESDEGKKKKQKKGGADWSALPPEERLRREEQRKKQIEAVERRARGEDKTAGYKHPLNSERRRANKRKPKWKSTSKGSPPNEHDTSGFQHRKHSKE